MTSAKLVNVMASKDWRIFDTFLSHLKQIVTLVENSSSYFSKSGLLNAVLKQLKKHLAMQNRDYILDLCVDLLTKNSSQSVKNDILRYFNVELCTSLHANERITFVHFCEKLTLKSSKRYFTETFVDSYLQIIQSERYQGVLVALLKTAR